LFQVNSRTSTAGFPANGTITQAALVEAMARRAQLYIFGDKSQLKVGFALLQNNYLA